MAKCLGFVTTQGSAQNNSLLCKNFTKLDCQPSLRANSPIHWQSSLLTTCYTLKAAGCTVPIVNLSPKEVTTSDKEACSQSRMLHVAEVTG